MIDVQSVICRILIESGIAGGNVCIADRPIEYTPPAVFVSDSSVIGNVNEGWWETTITVSCVSDTDYNALQLAHQVRELLDGWGGYGIEDIAHVSTIPMRNYETVPVTSTRVLTFRVLHEELKK